MAKDYNLRTAIGAMLGAFSPGKVTDLKDTVDLYVSSVRAKGISLEAGVAAARSYILGAVTGQSLTYAPVVPEFLIEAERIDEGMKLRATPKTIGEPWAAGHAGKTYTDKAIAYRKALGEKEHPIISASTHAKQWADWRAYFAWRGLKSSADVMDEHKKAEKGHTVPALSPFDFDPEFTTIEATA